MGLKRGRKWNEINGYYLKTAILRSDKVVAVAVDVVTVKIEFDEQWVVECIQCCYSVVIHSHWATFIHFSNQGTIGFCAC